MVSTPNNQSFSTDATAEQVGAFLQSHQEIEVLAPMLVGMIAVNQFKANGATALLVNLIAVTMTRKVLEFLKEPAILHQELQNNGRSYADVSAAEAVDDAQSYSIVHSIPGRIRLRVPRLRIDGEYANRVEELLNAEDVVINTVINRDAASLTIKYEIGVMTEWELGLRLMNVMNLAEDKGESVNNQGSDRDEQI